MYSRIPNLQKNICATCIKKSSCDWLKGLKPEFVLACAAYIGQDQKEQPALRRRTADKHQNSNPAKNPTVLAALAQGHLAGWNSTTVDNLLQKLIAAVKN